MMMRTALVLGVVLIALLANRVHGRRGLASNHGLSVGLTLVEAEGCRDCVAAARALTGEGIDWVSIDAGQAVAMGLDVRVAPTAIVTGADGDTVLVRRGRSVARDAAVLAACARRELAGQ